MSIPETWCCNEKNFPRNKYQERKETHTIIHVSLLTPLEPFFVKNSIHHPLYFSCHPSISTSSSLSSSSLRVSAPPWKPWGRSKPQKARAVSRPIHINAQTWAPHEIFAIGASRNATNWGSAVPHYEQNQRCSCTPFESILDQSPAGFWV